MSVHERYAFVKGPAGLLTFGRYTFGSADTLITQRYAFAKAPASPLTLTRYAFAKEPTGPLTLITYGLVTHTL